MAKKDKGTPRTEEPDVVEEVQWEVDSQGRYVFTDGGVTYVLATDGYAYAEPDLTDEIELEYAEGHAPATSDPAASTDDDVTQALEQVRARTSRGRVGRGRGARRGQDEGVGTPEAAPAADAPTMDNPVTVKSRAGRAAKGAGEQDAPVLLSLKDLRSGYGSLPVLHGVTVDVRRGETAVLLGLNGAGKTTTALNVCGALKAWGGTIEFDGQDITEWNTGKCVAAGVVMVPEGRRVFPDLSVEKNLQMGAWSQRRDDAWLEEGRERVYDYFPRMRERASQLAGTLSGGEQQMLAIGRGLMAKPKLLIIDEASMGLAPVIVQDVFDIVSQINADGVTVLLIEQNVGALDVADLGLVMEQGRMVKQLRGERLKDRSEVTEVLMG